MKVQQVAGEPTRFLVESATLECAKCGRHFNRRETRYKLLQEDGDCPSPGCAAEEALRMRWHLVDVACFQPIGQCSCEHFSFTLAREVEKLSPAALSRLTHNEQERLRCTHIAAARQHALTLTIRQHEQQRTGGRKELVS